MREEVGEGAGEGEPGEGDGKGNCHPVALEMLPREERSCDLLEV